MCAGQSGIEGKGAFELWLRGGVFVLLGEYGAKGVVQTRIVGSGRYNAGEVLFSGCGLVVGNEVSGERDGRLRGQRDILLIERAENGQRFVYVALAAERDS